MAVDPTEPFSREEQYLAAIAGEGTEVPPCPWNRTEAYLQKILDQGGGGGGGVQSDWAENDPADPAYIKNRPAYENSAESTVPQYGSTSAGATPDSGYVWFIEKIEDYALSDVVPAEDGDTVYLTITYSVNGVTRTDSAKFTAAVEDGNLNLDSDAVAGNRWRGAYASEIDGDTTFRWPVAAADSSATVYITNLSYEVVKELDAKYIPIDGETITIDEDGNLTSAGGGGPTVVQTTGTSQTDVMSQNAVTSMVYADPSTKEIVAITTASGAKGSNSVSIGRSAFAGSADAIAIGNNSNAGVYGYSVALGQNATVSASNGIAIGNSCSAQANRGIAIGTGSRAAYAGSIGLGAGAQPSAQGEMTIGTDTTSYGYNNTNYRLLTGVHDPVNAHDAATKGYVDAHSGGGAIELTTDDYNYHVTGATDDGVALWLLPEGSYKTTNGVSVYVSRGTIISSGNTFTTYHSGDSQYCTTVYFMKFYGDDQEHLYGESTRISDGLASGRTMLDACVSSLNALENLPYTARKTSMPVSAALALELKELIDAGGGGGSGTTYYISLDDLPPDPSSPVQGADLYSDSALSMTITHEDFRSALEGGELKLVAVDPYSSGTRPCKLVYAETYGAADFQDGNAIRGQFIFENSFITVVAIAAENGFTLEKQDIYIQ